MRLLFVLIVSALMALPAQAGERVIKKSKYSVAETADKFVKVIAGKGLTLFARIDHAAGAQKAGMDLAPMQLIIFGNPKMGTPLMQANQAVGLDLPLKVLVYKDGQGDVLISYLKPEVLKARHGIAGKDKIFNKMTGALDKMTGKAIE